MAHDYKGKGVTTHLITDANGHPIVAAATAANIDERKQVHPLQKKLKSWPLQEAILKADRGYTLLAYANKSFPRVFILPLAKD